MVRDREKTRIDRAKKFVMEFFLNNPDASINAAAQSADAHGLGLRKDTISEIRREALAELKKKERAETGGDGGGAPRTAQRAWRQGARRQTTLFAAPAQEAPATPAPADEQAAPPREQEPLALSPEELRTGRQRSPWGTAIRKKWLDDFILRHPDAAPQDVMSELRKTFGLSVDSTYVYASVRAARELHGLPPIPQRRHRSRHVVPEAAAPEEAPSEYLITYVRNGNREHRVVPASSLKHSILSLVVEGADESSIEVWRRSPIKFSITLE